MGIRNALKMHHSKEYKGSTPFTPISYYAKLCYKSPHPKFKHAAIIFHNGEIICHANNLGNHHAEVRAIKAAKILGHELGSEYILLSLRVTKTGRLALAKPCVGCLFHIKMLTGIRTILYSTDKQTIVRWGKEKVRK